MTAYKTMHTININIKSNFSDLNNTNQTEFERLSILKKNAYKTEFQRTQDSLPLMMNVLKSLKAIDIQDETSKLIINEKRELENNLSTIIESLKAYRPLSLHIHRPLYSVDADISSSI